MAQGGGKQIDARKNNYKAPWDGSIIHIIKGANIGQFSVQKIFNVYSIQIQKATEGVIVNGQKQNVHQFLIQYNYVDYIKPGTTSKKKRNKQSKEKSNKQSSTGNAAANKMHAVNLGANSPSNDRLTVSDRPTSSRRTALNKGLKTSATNNHTNPYGTYLINNTNITVCKGDITALQGVHAIVSSANPELRSSGGISKAISKKAGRGLEEWCAEYISRKGRIHVTECVASPAFSLPCKNVIHAVGPNPSAYTRDECFKALVDTLKNVLMIFVRGPWKSVAIPPLCTGDYGMQPEVFAKALDMAISTFVACANDSDLREIVIIDISDKVLPYVDSVLEDQYGSAAKSKRKQHSPKTTGPQSKSKSIHPAGHQRDGNVARPRTNVPYLQRPGDEKIHLFPSRYSQNYATGSSTDSVRALNSDMSTVDQYRPIPEYLSPSSQSDDDSEYSSAGDDDDDDDDDFCVICCDAITDKKILPKCKHAFCGDCIEQAFKFKPACPTCNTIYGALSGDQPKDGKMDVSKDPSSLPGYSRCCTIEIEYSFPDGVQGPEHPSPGKHYRGIRRTCYLPDNNEGNQVLKLLKKAFDSRLTFTIGRSTTTGREGVLTWNDIHHKTRRDGGPDRFGYPDPSYLDRVLDELAAKGIK